MPMTNQISRDELRSAIADKLCAHFGVTAETATDEQVFQAAAIVIREILSRLHTFDSRTAPEREVHYLSMEFLMGRSLMKDAFYLGIGDALTGALEDLGRIDGVVHGVILMLLPIQVVQQADDAPKLLVLGVELARKVAHGALDRFAMGDVERVLVVLVEQFERTVAGDSGGERLGHGNTSR